jgi:hypothetical protein
MIRYGHPIDAIVLGAIVVITAVAIKSWCAIRGLTPENEPLASWKLITSLLILGACLLAAGIEVALNLGSLW